MVSPERLDALQRQWVRLLDRFAVPPADAYPPFDRLAAAYTEPHRHYHTLEHLAEMFRVVGRLAGDCRNPTAVQLAVWYHDIVYDPRATDNEAASAATARDELRRLGVPPETVARVGDLIDATGHLAADPPADDPDEVVLRDADLAILGASEARYRRYAADTRREYAHVPDADYRRGRAAVLERFQARESIYRHPVMRADGEGSARRNLRAELHELAAAS
jgi:predicted metal-dependent HD superfamily phosphohydrolase